VTLNDLAHQAFKDDPLADMYQGRSGQQDQGRQWPYADQAGYVANNPAVPSLAQEPMRTHVSIGPNGSIDMLI